MQYRQIPPPAYLQPQVKFFWVLKNQEGNTALNTVAEGNPGLIFQDTAPKTFFQDQKTLPSFFLFGQATRHAAITAGPGTMLRQVSENRYLKQTPGISY